MQLEKIKNEFEKRYTSSCGYVSFCGKPITFLRGEGKIMGCCVSVGCKLAVGKREDDRVVVQFSHSDKLVTVNSRRMEGGSGEEVERLLESVKKLGVTVGGARLLFCFNSRLEVPYLRLLLMSLESFCDNIPEEREVLRCFGDFEEGVLCRDAKENYISVSGGKSPEYFPLNKERYRIVLTHINDKPCNLRDVASSPISRGVEALRNCDMEELGRLITAEAVAVAKKNGMKKTLHLLDVAKAQKESAGSGVLKEGGIFSLVESKEVDSFIRNVSAQYRGYYGGAPDFYVADTKSAEKMWIQGK